MTETYTYDAFGTLAYIQSLNEEGVLAKTDTAHSRFLYAEEQYDEVTGLYYLRARRYDTSIGRFTQEDTYLGDGRNLYVYVHSNPLKYVDSSGHSTKHLGYYSMYNLSNPVLHEHGKFVKKIYSWLEEAETFLENYKNSDGTYSLYDNTRIRRSQYREQILVIEISDSNVLAADLSDPNMQFGDDFSIGFGSIGIYGATNGWELKNCDLSLFDFLYVGLGGEVSFSEGIQLEAMAAVWKPKVEFKLDDGYIGIELNIISIGKTFSLGPKKKLGTSGLIGFTLYYEEADGNGKDDK